MAVTMRMANGTNVELTKEDFRQLMLQPMGYELNEYTNEWELLYPEKKAALREKFKKEKPKVKKSTAPTIKSGVKISKELVIDNIRELLEKQNLDFTLEKATFTINIEDDTITAVVSKKKEPFEFTNSFTGVKDFSKQKLINTLLSTTFASVGAIDKSGVLGFTDGKEYIAVKMTKKRK